MIDAWSGPTPISNQFPKNEPNGIRLLLDKIRGIETNLREVTSNLLRTAGIYLSPAGMTIDSNLTLTGTLTANGVIDNAALTTPPGIPAYVYDLASSFALTTTETVRGTYGDIVPAGRTAAVVSVTARANVTNPNTTGGVGGTGGDYVYCRVHVTRDDGQGPDYYSDMIKVFVAGNGAGVNVAPAVAILTNLVPGSHIVVDTLVSTSLLSWALFSGNEAKTVGTIQWLTWP